MNTIDASDCTLLVIDIQQKLMPAIGEAEKVLDNSKRLVSGAGQLGIPILATEQSPEGLGHMMPGLLPDGTKLFSKTTFDACRKPAFAKALDTVRRVVVAGCEAHVCVLQTVLGLIERDIKVHMVADATGSRQAHSKDYALRRMERAGADLVTTEMALFEWLGDAQHPKFREILRLVK